VRAESSFAVSAAIAVSHVAVREVLELPSAQALARHRQSM
jgi:hypothetical protein